MTTTFTRTREQLRDKVLGSMGVYDPQTGVTAEDSSLFYEALDLQLKSLHALGLLWWKVGSVTTNTTLTSGDSTEAAPSDMLYMVNIFIRSGTTDYPVEIITHREYQAIENKTDTGIPDRIYVDQEAQLLYLYPAPSSNYSMRMTYAKIIDDTAANKSPDVPQWALKPLVDILKFDLADHFEIRPEEKLIRWERRAGRAIKEIRIMNAPKVDHTTIRVVNF